MRYQIKQKVFSWRDRFTITDDQQRDQFFVEGELLSLGKKLRIFTMDNEEVLYIEQELFRLMPEFNLFVGKKQIATIKKRFHLFRNDYDIYGLNWTVEGDFLAHDYVIKERDQVIADINKRFFSWGDTYEINVLDEQQTEILLGIVIVIDCVLTANRNNNN